MGNTEAFFTESADYDDDFVAEEAFFPNLAPSEELRLLRARITQLEKMEQQKQQTVESQNGNAEKNGNVLSLNDGGQNELNDHPSIIDQQQLIEEITKMEQNQLQKNQQKEMMEKDDEQQKKPKETTSPAKDAISNDKFTQMQNELKTILERKFIELEKQQNEKWENVERISQKQMEICEKIGKLEEKQKEICEQMKAKHNEVVVKMEEKLKKNFADFDNAIQTKVAELDGQQKKLLDSIGILKEQFLNFQSPQNHKKKISILQQNCWDVAACHNELTISGSDNLTVHRNGNNCDWHSVFAKDSILNFSSFSDGNSSDIFYFEILVENVKRYSIIGIGPKQQQTQFNGAIRNRNGTYAYGGDGNLWVNGSWKSKKETFGMGDVVGFGVNLANKKLFFTKNGQRMGPANLSICSSPPIGQLFPCISLGDSDDKIEAKFGHNNFMFDLSTLF